MFLSSLGVTIELGLREDFILGFRFLYILEHDLGFVSDSWRGWRFCGKELASSWVRVSICVSMVFSGFGLYVIVRDDGTWCSMIVAVVRFSQFSFCMFVNKMIHSERGTKTGDCGGASVVCVLVAIWDFSQCEFSQVFMEAWSWCNGGTRDFCYYGFITMVA